MGPHMKPEEDKIAELIYLELRARGVPKTRAWAETGDLLYLRGHAPRPRDPETIRKSLIRSQRWRRVIAAQIGLVCEVVERQFEGRTHFGSWGQTYSKVTVLAGPISAQITTGGLGIHIQSEDGGRHFGAFEYVAVPGTPYAPQPPEPGTHRHTPTGTRADSGPGPLQGLWSRPRPHPVERLFPEGRRPSGPDRAGSSPTTHGP